MEEMPRMIRLFSPGPDDTTASDGAMRDTS